MPVCVKLLQLKSMCWIEFLSASVTAISCADPSSNPLLDILKEKRFINILISYYHRLQSSSWATVYLPFSSITYNQLINIKHDLKSR